MPAFLFYLFSGLAILSALAVICVEKPTRALLALVTTMFFLAALYVLLGAPFLAMVHLIVYAGAVLVLFLFVIMLQGIGARDLPLGLRFEQSYLLLAGFVGAAFLIVVTGALLGARTLAVLPSKVSGTVESIGALLFRHYLLPFELISLVLLVGILAAVSLAKREDSP